MFLPFIDTVYRLMMKLHDEAGHLVARSLLQYEFIVKANGKCVSNDRRRENAPAPQQALRPGLNRPSVIPLDPISSEPPAGSQRPQLNSSHTDPVLQRLSPAYGPVSGGPIIAILGINFPPPTQQHVYVKFGTVAVSTV